jgi:transketolase
MERVEGPTFLALSRQKVPLLDRSGELASAEGLRRGGYVIADASGGAPKVVLIGTGAELSVALDAREKLEGSGTPTRVVSLPSWHLFSLQEQPYRDQVLPPDVPARVSIEAASTFGWERWIGGTGRAIGLDHFAASAPAERLFEEFGFGVDHVVEVASTLLG